MSYAIKNDGSLCRAVAGPEEVGDDEYFSPTPVAAVVDLAQVRAELCTQIKLHRDHRTLNAGFAVGSNWFHSDLLSRDQQMKLYIAGKNAPDVPWKTMSGEFVQMTQALASKIVNACGANDVAIFATAEQHIKAVQDSDEPQTYDWTVGWPRGYADPVQDQ